MLAHFTTKRPTRMSRRLTATISLLVSVAACGRSPSSGATPVQAGVLITNATVIDGTGSPGRRACVRSTATASSPSASSGPRPATRRRRPRARPRARLHRHPQPRRRRPGRRTRCARGAEPGDHDDRRRPGRRLPAAARPTSSRASNGSPPRSTSPRTSATAASARRDGRGLPARRDAGGGAADGAISSSSEMQAGAIGLSPASSTTPGSIPTAPKSSRSRRSSARFGGRYISHIRSEDFAFWQAIDEIITIGREAKLPVQVSHMKLAMRSLWGRADSLVRLLDEARARGSTSPPTSIHTSTGTRRSPCCSRSATSRISRRRSWRSRRRPRPTASCSAATSRTRRTRGRPWPRSRSCAARTP